MKKSKRKILAVDDEERDRRLIQAMLIPHNYEVILARNGKEAADIAHRSKPDLILMDIMMPEMDGYTALAVIKGDKTTTEIPIIMVSAVGQELNKKLAGNLGAAGYITKPIDTADLLAAITHYISTPEDANSRK